MNLGSTQRGISVVSQSYINVIGAGLAGSEAAYQIAERGIPVKLYEMRGVKSTPQHKTENFAELVCSFDQCSWASQGRNASLGFCYLGIC